MIKLVLHSGNLLDATTETIVNPANSLGAMSGGVALAIKQAGGDAVEQAARNYGNCPVGAAFMTSAGHLPYRAIIHAPTMKHPGEPIPAKQIELATVAALRCADDNGFTSVALPALGTGSGGVDFETAARIMVETIQMFRSDNTLQRVEIWLNQPDALNAFQHYA